MKKRILAFALVLAIIFGVLPFSALAATEPVTEKIANVKAQQVAGSYNIKITFDAKESATNYIAYIYDSEGNKVINARATVEKGVTLYVGKPGVYTVKVIASVNGKYLKIADADAVKVTVASLLPEAPIVAAQNVTKTGFTVNWAAVEGAEQYFIKISGNGKTTHKHTTDTSIKVNGLASGTEYTVSINAKLGVGKYTGYEKTTVISTKDYASIDISAIMQGSKVALSWGVTAATADYFWIKRVDAEGKVTQIGHTSETNITVKSIEGANNFYIIARVKDNNGINRYVVSKTVTVTDPLVGANGKLGLGMLRFTADADNYLTDGVNTDADKLAEIEDVLAQGYVNTIFLEVDSLFEEKVALCRKYGCTFWIGPGSFNSKLQTIETYMANIEIKVNRIIEAGAWDLFQGFDWDEPISHGMSNEDFLTMTKSLYEKWGKRNFSIFAASAFIDGYGEGYTTIAPEYMEYVTDAGWDMYLYDVRDSALTNTKQNNAIASNNKKYGINCANAQEYYRWVHSEMMEKMNHNVNVWFFPAAYTRTAITGETIDEGYWLGHLNFFNQLLQEQTKPGGLIVYTYSAKADTPTLEQRLPVTNITTGEQIMFTDVEKYTTYAARLRELKTQYDNTPITIAKYVPSGTLNITKIGSDYINFLPVTGFEYSINGGTSWQTTGSFTNLTPETDYTICVKETQSGAVKNFAVSTLAVKPYASGLNDTASYAMKMPTNLNSFCSSYGEAGLGMGRTKDDTAFAASGASKYLHLKTIDGERFIELQNNNRDAQSSINLAFGNNGRPTSAKGISEGIDTAKLTAFAFRVKTTGGTDDQLSIFDFYIGGNRTANASKYPVKYIDKATGNVSNMTYQSGLNITGNIDGWIVIPFASYWVINKNWIINNIQTIQPWMHEENCGHNASASSWDNGKKLYMGDVMYVENIDTFISVHVAPGA